MIIIYTYLEFTPQQPKAEVSHAGGGCVVVVVVVVDVVVVGVVLNIGFSNTGGGVSVLPPPNFRMSSILDSSIVDSTSSSSSESSVVSIISSVSSMSSPTPTNSSPFGLISSEKCILFYF